MHLRLGRVVLTSHAHDCASTVYFQLYFRSKSPPTNFIFAAAFFIDQSFRIGAFEDRIGAFEDGGAPPSNMEPAFGGFV
jgi:hypothetical protein